MTGTGTEKDPLKPETWEEFLTAVATDGAYVSMPEGGEFDMNKLLPDGITTETPLNCAHIAGNGFTIRNLYASGVCAFRRSAAGLVIERLNFVDFYVIGGKTSAVIYALSPNYVELRESTVSGRIQGNSSSYYAYGVRSKMYRCSVNMECWKYSGLSGELDNCNVALEVHDRAATVTLTNSYLTGSFAAGITLENSARSVMNAVVESGTVKFTSPTNILVNSDYIAEGVTKNTNSNVLYLTTEQLKSSEYLQSVGFPIRR